MRGRRRVAIVRWAGAFVLLGILGVWAWSLSRGVQYDGSRWLVDVGGGRISIRFSHLLRHHYGKWFDYRIVNGVSRAFAPPYWGTDWAGTGPNVPFWLLALVVGAPTGVSWYRRPRRRVEGCCQKCGYNLTGNVSGRCPECGASIKGEQAMRVNRS